MGRLIPIVFVLILTIVALGMGRKESSQEKAVAADSTDFTSGILGRVEVWEGNFMPMMEPGRGGKITPAIGRRVRLHDPVTMNAGGLAQAKRDSVATTLIAETVTDSTGQFRFSVSPGDYSIFVEENGGWYYNGWNSEGVQGAVAVHADSVSDVLIKITTKAIH